MQFVSGKRIYICVSVCAHMHNSHRTLSMVENWEEMQSVRKKNSAAYINEKMYTYGHE